MFFVDLFMSSLGILILTWFLFEILVNIHVMLAFDSESHVGSKPQYLCFVGEETETSQGVWLGIGPRLHSLCNYFLFVCFLFTAPSTFPSNTKDLTFSKPIQRCCRL